MLCDNLEVRMGWEVGGRLQKGGDMGIPMADSCCTVETNTKFIKTVSSN